VAAVKLTDLDRAHAAAAELAAAERLAGRLEAGEAMRLLVGAGGNESEIVLAAGFAADLRAQLAKGLRQKAGQARERLAAMGVEP
jgi:hypothetical protein